MNIERKMRQCEQCGSNKNFKSMVRKSSVIFESKNGSACASKSFFYYCPECVPKDNTKIPEPKVKFVSEIF